MKTGLIYAIVNLITGRVYIGQTVRPLCERKRNHLFSLRHGTHGNQHLQRSYNKHGANAFEFYRLRSDIAIQDLTHMEQYFLDLFRSTPTGVYNADGPASSPRLGLPHTPETLAKMSRSHMGKPGTTTGRKTSEETRRLLSESARKRWAAIPPAERKAIRARRKQKTPHLT